MQDLCLYPFVVICTVIKVIHLITFHCSQWPFLSCPILGSYYVKIGKFVLQFHPKGPSHCDLRLDFLTTYVFQSSGSVFPRSKNLDIGFKNLKT